MSFWKFIGLVALFDLLFGPPGNRKSLHSAKSHRPSSTATARTCQVSVPPDSARLGDPDDNEEDCEDQYDGYLYEDDSYEEIYDSVMYDDPDD